MSGVPVVLVGAGALGLDALSVHEALVDAGSTVPIEGFVDDAPEARGQQIRGFGILGGLEWLEGRGDELTALVTVGSPSARSAIHQRLASMGVGLTTWVHPAVTRTRSVSFGPGCLIMGNASFTIEVEVGRGVVVNPGATIAHEVRLGDDAYVCPGAHLTGRVVVEERVFIGTGAVITPGCRIGADAVVGAGAVVTQDVAAGTTVVGVPARPLPRP